MLQYDIILDGDKVDSCGSLKEVGSKIKDFFDLANDYSEQFDNVTFHISKRVEVGVGVPFYG